MRRVLVLYRHSPDQPMRTAVRDHLHALDGGPEQIVYHNAFDEPPSDVRGVRFDGVVLHTTFLCERWSDRFTLYRERYAWLADLPCAKVALPQDEYDHSEVLDEWLAELGVSDVFSIFAADVRPILYPRLHDLARFRRVLTGYIDDASARRCAERLRPLAERHLDVVYRASKLPYWFGSHGQLKHRIAEVVAARAAAHDLTVDISTRWEDTIFGDAWYDFIASGRAVIGAESGSSVLDRRGEIQARIRALLAEQPDLTFEDVARELPQGWDSARFFAISPRHLEAVVTKTAQVLVDGTYSDVLQPGRHFIALRRDLSNVDEVLERLRDHRHLQEIADRAYEEIYVEGRYRYRDFAADIRESLDEAPQATSRRPRRPFALVRNTPAARVKHAADRAVGGLALLASSPVLGALGLWVLADSGAPVLVSDRRLGKHGRSFRTFRFRTSPTRATVDGLTGGVPANRSGRFLLRTRLHALPQLPNVVRGELSLVGPRAEAADQFTGYVDDDPRWLSVKPGITGWAQVNGREAADWRRRYELDAWYVEHWTLPLDVRILLRTALRLFRGRSTA